MDFFELNPNQDGGTKRLPTSFSSVASTKVVLNLNQEHSSNYPPDSRAAPERPILNRVNITSYTNFEHQK